jgi:hypothetical protein
MAEPWKVPRMWQEAQASAKEAAGMWKEVRLVEGNREITEMRPGNS